MITNLVHFGEFFSDDGFLDRGLSGVKNIDNHLLAGKQPVGHEFACANCRRSSVSLQTTQILMHYKTV